MNALDQFYDKQEEPNKSIFLAMKEIILSMDKDITNELKYGMPMFCYKGKMFCYLWKHKKYKQPYLGIVEGERFDHPLLIQEKRARMKIMLLDSGNDLPLKTIKEILSKALSFYKDGIVKR